MSGGAKVSVCLVVPKWQRIWQYCIGCPCLLGAGVLLPADEGVSHCIVPRGPVVVALHARRVDLPLPFWSLLQGPRASPCQWPLQWAAPGPHGGGRLDPGSLETFAGSILAAVHAWLPH